MLKKFVLGSMVVVAALLGNACGDDGSNDSPAAPADSELTLSSSSDDVALGNSSSSSVTESPLTSSGQAPQSAESDGSSSSEKAVDGSSSSDGKTSSSSGKVESSSSSSSSDVVAESSSSEKSSSSVAESSSSVESSSSEEQSSSSVVESSSSVAESSSSLEIESSSSITLSSSSETPTVKSIYDAENNTLTDLRDNQVYKTVTIGEQIWMAENLNYDYKAGSKSFCYNDSTKYCDSYGRLYVKEIKDTVCPDKWHLPDSLEWEKIIQIAGWKNGPLKADSSWAPWQNKETNGTNETGFSALAAGMRTALGSGYGEINRKARFWMAGKINRHVAIDIFNDEAPDYLFTSDGVPAYSIRCLKDSE